MKDNSRRIQKIYYQSSANSRELFPHIRIAGKYLKGFDFNVGDSIEVNIEKGKITVFNLSENTPPPPIVQIDKKEPAQAITENIEIQETQGNYSATNLRDNEIKNVRQNKTKGKGLQR